jgi:hypothetical protein
MHFKEVMYSLALAKTIDFNFEFFLIINAFQNFFFLL